LQVDPEPNAADLEDKLNLSDEQKQAEVEEGEKTALPERSNPKPPAVVEVSSHTPAPVVEDPQEEDLRQHLNVVFIGHVGTDYVIRFNSVFLKIL